MGYNGHNAAIIRLQMELMLWRFTVVHRPSRWVTDADYFSRTGQTCHIDPLLIEYDTLWRVIYERNKPVIGDIRPENLPGFKRQRNKVDLQKE